MSTRTPGKETEAIAHLDQDWAIACEDHHESATGASTEERCDHLAAWWVVCRHCRDATAHCNPHATLWARLVPALGAACAKCGTAVCGAHASSLFEAHPIGTRP